MATIKVIQKHNLIESWKSKKLHGISRIHFEKDNFSKMSSSMWLTNGNISPKQEGSLTLLQDRNYFWINKANCDACQAPMNVDHIATRCTRLVSHEYRRRHDEAVKCIALKLAKNYLMTNSKSTSRFSVGDILDNERARIIFDKPLTVERNIKHNRPDILVFDKMANSAIIFEIGISSFHEYDRTENEKFEKYIELADTLESQHKLSKVKIVPLIFSWEGFISKRCSSALKSIGMSKRESAYLLTRILKRTEEIVQVQARRSVPISSRDEN